MVAPTSTPSRRDTPTWLWALGVGVGYFVFAQGLGLASVWLSDRELEGPVFWPAAGIGLGAMLVTPRTRWPALVAAVFVAEVTSNLFYGLRGPSIALWGLANALHPLVAATLIRRFHPQFALRSLPQLWALVFFGGVVGPAVSATVGTATSVYLLDGSWSTFEGWWAGDGLGVLVIAPLFVAYRAPRFPRSLAETVIGWGALLAVSVLFFRDWGSEVDVLLPYLVLPPLIWAALRLGLRGASGAVAVVGLAGGVSSSLSFGLFPSAVGLDPGALFQIYLAVLAVTALLIASLVADLTERDEIQREAERRQRQQAALADLGRQLLVVESPDEVIDRVDAAVKVISERPRTAGRPGAHAAVPEVAAVGDPFAPLAAHHTVLSHHPSLAITPVAADDAALVEAAASQAASALDRLAQAEVLRERAAALERANEQLARAITFREQLVSMVSHELRSPLTPILGFAEVLRRSLSADGSTDARFALDAIERNARRILALVDELLVAARAAEDRVPAHPVVLDVATTILQALEHVHDDVSVIRDPAGPSWALVDPGHLSQCVLNLVGNALKYGEQPTEVHVRNDGDSVVVEVCDHGSGVPDALVPTLFDRFTQADGSAPDLGGGVGLGLSIVRTLIELNGGTVTYQPPDDQRPVAFVLRVARAEGEARRTESVHD